MSAAFVVIERAEVPAVARPRGGSRKGKEGGLGSFVAALMNGQTVFIADANQANSWLGSARQAAARHGLRIKSRRMERDGLAGFGAWTEALAASPEDPRDA